MRVLFLFFFLFSSCGEGEYPDCDKRYTISGIVVDNSGTAVVDVLIKPTTNDDSSGESITTTDSNGNYVFTYNNSRLSWERLWSNNSGNLQIKAVKNGFTTKNATPYSKEEYEKCDDINLVRNIQFD